MLYTIHPQYIRRAPGLDRLMHVEGVVMKPPPAVSPLVSRVMARVRSKDTQPELRVRQFLHSSGLRYRLHRRDLPGKPDLAFPRAKVAIFVHGCFWHRHRHCPKTRTPKSHIAFWKEKFAANIGRDRKNARQLRRQGWTVLIIWECQTHEDNALRILADQIRGCAAHCAPK